jgi:hypothetical protein
VPVIGGCAGALIAGPVGGLAGVVVAQSVEKAINLFGKGIVEKWREWFATATPEDRAQAAAELAALAPDVARDEARAQPGRPGFPERPPRRPRGRERPQAAFAVVGLTGLTVGSRPAAPGHRPTAAARPVLTRR